MRSCENCVNLVPALPSVRAAVNGIVANTFIPAIKNAEVKAAFQGALVVFQGHEQHVQQLVARAGR